MRASKISWVLGAALAGALSALAMGAGAQGRHDDKPHGMKKLDEREMADPKVHPGGPRHSEQGHKAAIKASQDRAAKKSEPTKAAPPAQKEQAPAK